MGWSHGKRWSVERIETELWEVTKKLRRMPTYRDLQVQGYKDLLSAMRRRGGLRRFQATMKTRLAAGVTLSVSEPEPTIESDIDHPVTQSDSDVSLQPLRNTLRYDSSEKRNDSSEKRHDSSKGRAERDIVSHCDTTTTIITQEASLESSHKLPLRYDSSAERYDSSSRRNDSSEKRAEGLPLHRQPKLLQPLRYALRHDSSKGRSKKPSNNTAIERNAVKNNVIDRLRLKVKQNNLSMYIHSDNNLNLKPLIVEPTTPPKTTPIEARDGDSNPITPPQKPAQLGLLGDEVTQSKATSKKKRTDEEVKVIARRLFDVWVRFTKRTTGRTFLTPKRIRTTGARLRQGYAESALEQAIRGFAASPWHQGENPQRKRYDDLAWIFKDGDTVERGIGYYNDLVQAPELERKKEEAEERAEHEFLRKREERSKKAAELKAASLSPPQEESSTWTSEELEDLFEEEDNQ